jgi:hypothetical protein
MAVRFTEDIASTRPTSLSRHHYTSVSSVYSWLSAASVSRQAGSPERSHTYHLFHASVVNWGYKR